MSKERYSSFISLNKFFKDVFSVEDDLDNSDIWKKYIFTKSFKEILTSIDFLFKSENFKKKSIILSGKYGVGKSHTLAVMSHVLWDDIQTIKPIIETIKRDADIPGHTLAQFREGKKYFPVILSGKDSNEISDERTFDFRLQIALEEALKKYGLFDKISEKSEFDLYYNWLKTQCENDNASIYLSLKDNLGKTGQFGSVEELIEALSDRDPSSLSIIKDLVTQWGFPPPYHIDSFGYYENVLKELQTKDNLIIGIIIYWDEFTTVFEHAGRSNNAKILQKIQEWAEKASSNIILFLVSHRSPEAFRGKYSQLEDELAKIENRFQITHMKMEKNTTYELIEKSLVITNNDYEAYRKYLGDIGLNATILKLFVDQYKNLFNDIEYTDKKIIRTLPLHPYSVYVATKIANLIGSAERSIFQLLHSTENIKTIYGTKLGFAAFIELEPSDEDAKLFSIDQVFDFFYDDLRQYNFDKVTYSNILQTINSFTRYFPIVENLGNDAIKVFKTLVLMQMLHEFEHEAALVTTKNNIETALIKSNIKNVGSILEKLKENSILILYDRGLLPEEYTYKIRIGDYDQESLEKIISEVSKEQSFEKYVARRHDLIAQNLLEGVLDVPRLRGTISTLRDNNIEVKSYSSNDISKLKSDIKNLDSLGKFVLTPILSDDSKKFDLTRTEIIELSKKYQNQIFLLYEGPFDECYNKWIEALSQRKLGQERSNKQLIEQGDQLERTEKETLEEKLKQVTLICQGLWVKKTSSIGLKLAEFIEKIYPRGFDYLKYNSFWESPKGYSESILNCYGEPDGKKQIFDETHQVKKKIHEIFIDKNGDPLVDNKLFLRDEEFVRSSSLYENVEKIKSYLMKKTGSFISLRSMIDDLELERPPFGLCGWIESLVITYALAEFKKENRLEVKFGNVTPSKDGIKIVDAINDAIKKAKKNHQIRYGTSDELQLAKNLIGMFSLDEETIKTLAEVTFKIRHKNSTSFGLPLWVIPYAYEGEKKEALEKCLTQLNQVIVESDRDKIISDTELEQILRTISEIEKQYNKSIWATLFSKSTFSQGFEKYISARFIRIYHFYPSSDIVIDNLKTTLEGEPWAWTETKVANQLTSLLNNSAIPERPQNIHSHLEEGGLILEWDAPPQDSGIPLKYIIQRKEEDNSFVIIEKINAKNTTYTDQKIKPGITYTYVIIAENGAGKSEPCDEYKKKILPILPPINLTINAFEEYFTILWEKPNDEYEIDFYKIFRGSSPSNMEEIKVKIPNRDSEYLDYDVNAATRYFYRIDAYNTSGMKCHGKTSQPVLLTYKICPPPPENPSAVLFNEGIQISWSHPENGCLFPEKYCIYRKDQHENQKIIAMPSANETKFFDNGVTIGETYSYSISAHNSAGESQIIPFGTIEIPLQIPPVNAHLRIINQNVILEWNSFDEKYGVKLIEIKRGEKLTEIYHLGDLEGNITNFTDDSVKIGQHYYYQIVVKGANGCLKYSNLLGPISLSVPIDIEKWEGDTISLAKNDRSLFLKQINHIIQTLIDDPLQTERVKENDALKKIRTIIEGIIND
jgi:hypothetical protein